MSKIRLLPLVLILILGFPADHIAAQPLQQSVGLGPPFASAAPGETVSYTASANSSEYSFSGAIQVDIPQGLSVVGEPNCISGCNIATASKTSSNTLIDATIDAFGEESARISFFVAVDAGVKPGKTFYLGAYFLHEYGMEYANATLTVIEALPTQPVTEVPLVAASFYLDATPTILRVAPGGVALYFLQPIIWTEDQPDYTITFAIPSDAASVSNPICGTRQSLAPTKSICEVTTSQENGKTVITASPGFTGNNSNGLYVSVQFAKSFGVGSVATLEAVMDVPSIDEPQTTTMTAVSVDFDEVDDSNGSGTVAFRYEMVSGYVRQGTICSPEYANGDEVIALYEYGEADITLSEEEMVVGKLDKASDGSGRDVCAFEYEFNQISSYSVFMVAEVSEYSSQACRACVLGVITTGVNSQQVILRDDYPG